MSEDETIEAMSIAAWEVRRRYARFQLKDPHLALPPWGQTEPKVGESPFYFCTAEHWLQCLEEMRAALKAIPK